LNTRLSGLTAAGYRSARIRAVVLADGATVIEGAELAGLDPAGEIGDQAIF